MSTSCVTRTRSVSAKKRRRETTKAAGVPTVRECDGGWSWKGEQETRYGCRHFSAITKNSKVVCIGDIVLIYGNSKENYYIAKILAFTENMTDQQMCARIEWLYWPNELLKILKKLPKHQRPELPACLSNEVIFTNSNDSVEVSSIAGKTEVTIITTSTTCTEKCARYVARWHFDIKMRKLTPLTSSKQAADSAKTSPLKDGRNTTKSTTPQSNKEKVSTSIVHQHSMSNSKNQESPIPKATLQKPYPLVVSPPKPPVSHTPSGHTPFRSESENTPSYSSPSSRQTKYQHYFDLLCKKPDKQSPLSTTDTPKQKRVYSLTSALTPKNVSFHNSTRETPQSITKQSNNLLSPFTAKSSMKAPLFKEKQLSTLPSDVVTPQPSLGGKTPELKEGSFSPSSSTKSSPDVVGCRRQLKLDVSGVLESLSDIDEDAECSDMEVEGAKEPKKNQAEALSRADCEDNPELASNSLKNACPWKSREESRGDTLDEKPTKVTAKESRILRSTRKSRRLEEDEDPLTTVGRSQLKPTRKESHESNNKKMQAEALLLESDMETENQVETVTPKTNQTNKSRMTRSQMKKLTSSTVKEIVPGDFESTPDVLSHTTSACRNTRSQSRRAAMSLESDVLITTPRSIRSKVEHPTKNSGVNISASPDLRKTKPNKSSSTARSTTKAKRKRKRIVQQVKRSRVTVASSNGDNDNDSPYLTESEQESDNISIDEEDSPKSDENFVDMRTLKLKTPRTVPRKRPSPNATPVSAKKRRLSVSASTTKKRVKSILKRATAARRRKCLTPSVPQRVFCRKQSGDHFDIAKERLHVSAVPESLPCRENEFASILSFVEGKLRSKTGGCMYISGVPGTGKTATVMEVTGYLRQAAEDKELPDFKFVDINGMRLTDPHQVYVSILKQLTGEKATPTHAATLLDKYFSSNKNKTPTVLLADELDLLWTRKQTVLYNLFEWPSRLQAKLIVLAVANTMDLPERIMMNKVSSRLGLTRLTFHPYTFQQLQEIVTSRMTGLRVFEPDAIQLAARKVAAVSGDARRALDISRRATEICQSERNHGGRKTKEAGLVGMHHVDKAVQEMFSSAKIQAIKHVSLHEKMFLKAILSEFRRTGLEEATFKHVCQQLQVLYRAEGVQSANMTQLSCICSRLGARRLLLVEGGRMDIHRRIRLNISQDDVIFALRDV